MKPKMAIVDLGYRGREVDGVEILHRGKSKRLTRRQWTWVKRRQAIEPIIGHDKDDCGMRRCRLQVHKAMPCMPLPVRPATT